MRKIEQNVVSSFLRRKARSQGNTHTDGTTLYLHDNAIAWWTLGPEGRHDRLVMTLAGWPTPTTRSRLNALCRLTGQERRFYQQDFEQYFGQMHISADDRVEVRAPAA